MKTKTSVSEEAKLKEKINQLIDKVDEHKKTISEQNLHIQEIQEEIKMLQVQANCSGAKVKTPVEEENEIFAFIKDFCLIARLIIENTDYIKYQYETKFSSSFYKIEQTVFENYICKYSIMDIKTFLGFCIDMALIKSEQNRKCVYSSGNIRVYYMSRLYAEKAIGQDNNQEA